MAPTDRRRASAGSTWRPGKTRARRLGDPVRAARQGRRRRGQQHLRLPVGRPARLHRRPAGADELRSRRTIRCSTGPWKRSSRRPDRAGCSWWSTATSTTTTRWSRSHRPRQGQQPGHPHAGHRRVAGGAGGRELRQPLRHGGPLLRRDPTEPARPAFHCKRWHDSSCAPRTATWCRCRRWSGWSFRSNRTS